MHVELNGHEFFINVLEPNIGDSSSPTYQASCGLAFSEIYMSSSTAITLLYQQLFGTKTKFSRPLAMGFNQSDIVKQLLKDINFQPFEFYLDQLRIVVFEIGVSKNQDWNYVGTGYQSSLVNNIGKKRFIYVQSFISNKCNITIYEENKIKLIVNGTTPTDIWSKIDYKPKFDANDLF
ncbi:6701_t:CDS:1, partial [Gigaspora rosea]